MEELTKLKQEAERAKIELGMLYEISNAMRTTLKLDEILYIILTGVTAHTSLGFNRALLFLVNERDKIVEGKMGIGPENGVEANRIWTQIEQEKKDFEDLISAYKTSATALDSAFNTEVKKLKFSLHEGADNLLATAILEGMPLHLTKETVEKYRNSPLMQLLKSDDFVLVPLKAKDKVNGIIVADNFITKKPISKDDLRMLIMLANQAGLAIENSQLYEKTVMQAHLDYLTGLWNHGYFQFILQEELERAKITQKPLCLVMLDIDDFKIYNDALGHQTGDEILKELATLLKNQSRKMDFVCRYGGEEFTIVLPEIEKKEARFIAERLRIDVERKDFAHKEILPQKKLTVSMGIASFPENGSTPSEVIAASDKMLYQAKNKGKNSVCCF
jgi:diguanylate cyclase (GGDEF)-like protein